MRAQISQIERYNQAANTFKTKYGYLPGDIPAASVTQFGFIGVPTRAGVLGRGNGDGMLEGYDYTSSTGNTCGSGGICSISGEPSFFWEDLSVNTHLIPDIVSGVTDAVIANGWVVERRFRLYAAFGDYAASQAR